VAVTEWPIGDQLGHYYDIKEAEIGPGRDYASYCRLLDLTGLHLQEFRDWVQDMQALLLALVEESLWS
jgi:hypothetical protein